MADPRQLVLGMEEVVNETAELAAALRLCTRLNSEEGLWEAERAGIHRLASIVQERAECVLAAWQGLDAATYPAGAR